MRSGTVSLTATAGDINLGTLTNDFVGAVTASGTNITLADANSLSASITALGVGEDRASTRLHSSHDQISYAVFCMNGTSTSFGGTGVGGNLATLAGPALV